MNPGLSCTTVMALVATAFWCSVSESQAADVDFERDIRPLLTEHCASCHGGVKKNGGFSVLSRELMLSPANSGVEALQPGNAAQSELIRRITSTDSAEQMPPEGQDPLTSREKQLLHDWIQQGATWPSHWAYAALPDSGDLDSDRHLVDRFVRDQLDNLGLTPSPPASGAMLVRRMFLDLTGLLPEPAELQQLNLSDEMLQQPLTTQDVERLADYLLASPHFGERWARHWLDLVRYAESDGYRADIYRPEAWRYRDYVIQSLNEDKPYDRFVQEQLAGDELFPDDPAALVATGFLRHGIFEYNVPDIRGQWDNILNEVTDVTADVFFGLGFQCARCHDHKFDPLLQKDYFRLRAFFEATLPRDDVIAAAPEEKAQYKTQEAAYREKSREIQEQLDALLEKPLHDVFEATIKRYPDDLKEVIRKAPEERTPHEQQLFQFADRLIRHEQARVDSRIKGEAKDQVLALRRELARFDSMKPKSLPRPMTISDVGRVAPKTIIPKKKTEVAPGFPTILEPEVPTITPPQNVPDTTGRRSVLAQWLTRPENPLSTRVIVNRVWQYHFGRGLAANGSDFGQLGGAPTHPELLDWLTSRFLENGWHLKGLHRLIVTSATYRQAASHPQLADFQLKDPLNRWYWRGEVRRLDAEQIRDAIFAVTGPLQSGRGGPSVLADRPRRSIYTRVMRNSHAPLLEVFDLPQFISSSSNRDSTTTPVQSLLLINSQVMLAHAGALADRVHSLSDSDDVQTRLERLWWLTFGRPPTADELNQAMSFLHAQEQMRLNERQDDSVPANVATGQVPYRDGQAVLFEDQPQQERFQVPADDRLNTEDFTFEAIFQLRSVYESGAVRTLGAKMARQDSRSGWLLGISGKGSRRKPQSLVLQIFGQNTEGRPQEVVLFSDHHLELNKPYYAAVSVRMKTPEAPGVVTFHLKDLSNDEEPLST
ncbi:MAG: DUF1553 domain-containing protein, partial [Planctomycetaceae bacterium]|nr:DUF1553 domain-containing protein [Planctomycetaceae bacterium]